MTESTLNTVIIIQARMTSTRLPGKVLKELCEKPMLAQQVARLQRCELVDEIAIATTINTTDDPVVALAEDLGLPVTRGSEADVLSRYVEAAAHLDADLIVRITADCPLIAPEVVDRVIRELLERRESCDYAANVLKRTYPRGLDTEAFFRNTLLRADELSQSRPSREHVTTVIRQEHPDEFRVHSVEDSADNSDLRWTVDRPVDFEAVEAIYRGLNLSERYVPYHETVEWVRAHPEIMAINSGGETWDPSRER